MASVHASVTNRNQWTVKKVEKFILLVCISDVLYLALHCIVFTCPVNTIFGMTDHFQSPLVDLVLRSTSNPSKMKVLSQSRIESQLLCSSVVTIRYIYLLHCTVSGAVATSANSMAHISALCLNLSFQSQRLTCRLTYSSPNCLGCYIKK